MLRGISPFFQQVEPKPHLVLCRGLWLAWLIVKREGEASGGLQGADGGQSQQVEEEPEWGLQEEEGLGLILPGARHSPRPAFLPPGSWAQKGTFYVFLAGNGKERRAGLQASLLPVLIPSKWPASSSASPGPHPADGGCLHTDPVTQIPGGKELGKRLAGSERPQPFLRKQRPVMEL